MNTTYSIFESTKLMKIRGKIFMLIFYQNTEKGDAFTSLNEVLSSNTSHKYSILGKINEQFQYRGKYEFLYEVPGIKGYNIFRQKLHPKDTTSDMNEDQIQFEPIKLSWPSGFGGIRRNNNTCTFFKCATKGVGWWYSIGVFDVNSYPNKMPTIRQLNYKSSEVKLWVRVPPSRGFDALYSPCRNQKAYSLFLHVSILIVSS